MTHRGRHINNLQPTAELGEEVGGTGECNTTGHDETVIKEPVLTNTFAEWAALVVDGKSRDLLR